MIIIGKLRMILTALTRERVAIKALTFSWPNLKINPKKYKEESIARRREIIKKKRHLRVFNLCLLFGGRLLDSLLSTE